MEPSGSVIMKYPAVILMALLLMSSMPVRSKESTREPLPFHLLPELLESRVDHHVGTSGNLRADTVWFGGYQIINGDYYARSAVNDKQSVMWTFDRGQGPFNPPPPLIPSGEGFARRDLTRDASTYFRVIDVSVDLGHGVPAPIISGARSLWVGLDKPQADALCWSCGPGYGNAWCQRVVSPPLQYNGSGDIVLSFKYFQKSEPCYDGTQVYLRREDSSELLLNPYPSGACANNLAWDGGFTDSIASYNSPATCSLTATHTDVGGAQDVRFIFEFRSDNSWSDEDGDFCTIWGPFAMDDFSVMGGGISFFEDWEGGLNDWTPGLCSPVGDYIDVVDVGCYTILDPCACRLQGSILEMHAGPCDQGFHPIGQHCWVESPIVDTGNSDVKSIFADFDAYAIIPLENGVLFRAGWMYYPLVCPATGQATWSGRVGTSSYGYGGADPFCASFRIGGTDTDGIPVPSTARMVRLVLELMADCSAFAIDPCSGVTNQTPLFDNIAVGVTSGHMAPIVSFDIGAQYQDVGSYLSTDPIGSARFDPRMPGPANVARDFARNYPTVPHYCGDSLVVSGPLPNGSDPNTKWEARMWWRVARRSPFNADRENGSKSRYKTWKNRVADGRAIDRPYKPQFTWGWMDSNQVGLVTFCDRFVSCFREDDDDFMGEGREENEMIWDDILYPGSKIEYFITSDFKSTPGSLYYLPDTSGGNFLEFEVLPGVRVANVPGCGGTGFNYCAFHPSTLYIHVGGWPLIVENALRTILDGMDPCDDPEGCAIIGELSWDRYDYADASSSWNAPFARDLSGSNNGMTLSQILGYRAILLDTGGGMAGVTEEVDYWLYDQWLRFPLCDGNSNRQMFIMNGIKAGELLMNPTWTQGYGSGFLNNTLGAILQCDAFNGFSEDPACSPPTSDFCVRLLPVSGGSFSTELDIDAWGNYCPYNIGFNVYDPNGSGHGNRYYQTESGDKTGYYAQVTNQDLGPAGNYRTVLDGVDWALMTVRNPGGSGIDVCPRDLPSVIAGALSEMGAALKWGFGASNYSGIPKLTSAKVLAGCEDTWDLPAEVRGSESPRVNRLFGNEPNPFNPRTSVRFSLANEGPVTIAVYDAGGRLVRTLQDGWMAAGPHALVWDGTRDGGAHVGSGVFWVQMKVGPFVSNKQLVMIR
jgi:hypothetical protein